MKRNIRSVAVGARKAALRRKKRERLRYMCCMRCEKALPGRLGKAEKFRPTERAEALNDQLNNS